MYYDIKTKCLFTFECSTSIFSKLTTYFSASDQKVKSSLGDLPLIDATVTQLQQIFDVS